MTQNSLPTTAEIDQWCRQTQILRQLASLAFVPGQGVDMTAHVVASTLPDGTHLFQAFPGDLDPTNNKYVAMQAAALRQNLGGVIIRSYHVKLPLGNIDPADTARVESDQQHINNPENWVTRGI
jgi:hypothetical protein